MNNGRDCKHGRQVGKCDSCELELAEKQIAELETERDALAAQVEILRSSSLKVRDLYSLNNTLGAGTRRLVLAWDAALSAEPSQALAEIRAEAVNDFIEFMYKSADCNLCEKSLDVAVSYAERIRQGEVK